MEEVEDDVVVLLETGSRGEVTAYIHEPRFVRYGDCAHMTPFPSHR